MTLTRRQAWLLVAAAVWTLYVWITRVWVIAHGHHPTGFVVVHVSLAVISCLFALAVGRIGVRALRRARQPAVEAQDLGGHDFGHEHDLLERVGQDGPPEALESSQSPAIVSEGIQ